MGVLDDGSMAFTCFVEGHSRWWGRRCFNGFDNSCCFAVPAHRAATAVRAGTGAAAGSFATDDTCRNNVLLLDFGADFDHAHFGAGGRGEISRKGEGCTEG